MNLPEVQAAALRVLLVEDNALDAELTQAHLAGLERRAEVTLVHDEAGFRAALRAASYDVILADFVLPEFSGIEALGIARALAPETPFIFVSGVLGEEHAVDMLKRGATDYVLKQRLQRLPVVVGRAIAEADERHSRIRAERSLYEYETSFRLLIDALRDYAVIGLDRDGRVRSWNSAAERILGFAADEILGQHASRLHQQGDPQEVLEAIEGALRHGSHVSDRWMKRRSGEDFFASVVTTAIRADSGELLGFSKIVRDTTEARRQADTLRLAKEQAEAANAAKDRFLAMLSHELRTPLTPILAATTLLEGRAPLPPELRELLPMIRRNVELEARLIDDLLDLTSISHDKLNLNLAALDLHAGLGNVVQMAQAEAEKKRQQFETRLQARHTEVNGDAQRVQQIVWNLLRNAFKFTPEHGRITLESYNPDPGQVALRVTDTGIGIAEAALPRIFSAFEQADTSITREFGGLGLGLAIAQALALKHGGSLCAESDGPQRGARFTLTLPLCDAAAEDAPPAAEGAADAARRALHVLLVEDNGDTAMALGALLQLSGHRVATAGTVREALELSARERFDLLISDLGLPDGDGVEVVRAFRRHGAPSIAVTGYGMDQDLRRCREAGFTTHVTKPVSFERLDQLIRKLTAPG